MTDGRRIGGDGLDGASVRVFVRRGCPYCSALRTGLRRAGLAFEEIDIWSDDGAAAFVRRHADGNETVPTVEVGDVVLVNPSPPAVLAAAARAGISLDPPPPSVAERAAAAARRWSRRGGAG